MKKSKLKIETVAKLFKSYATNKKVTHFIIDRGRRKGCHLLWNPPHRDAFSAIFGNYPVHRKPYRMNVNWTKESEADMKDFFNLKIEDRLIEIASEEMILNENK